MMVGQGGFVNERRVTGERLQCGISLAAKDGAAALNSARKKSRAQEPGLRYWPREADTITFQEGLLNARATGGGGQMRNANAQRGDTMVPAAAMRQPFSSHVRHAAAGVIE
jgi:hypothetical protein